MQELIDVNQKEILDLSYDELKMLLFTAREIEIIHNIRTLISDLTVWKDREEEFKRDYPFAFGSLSERVLYARHKKDENRKIHSNSQRLTYDEFYKLLDERCPHNSSEWLEGRENGPMMNACGYVVTCDCDFHIHMQVDAGGNQYYYPTGNIEMKESELIAMQKRFPWCFDDQKKLDQKKKALEYWEEKVIDGEIV